MTQTNSIVDMIITISNANDWIYNSEVKDMSENEFYKQDNIRRVCQKNLEKEISRIKREEIKLCLFE